LHPALSNNMFGLTGLGSHMQSSQARQVSQELL